MQITVADTGPGIPADVLPRIFDPFFSTKKGGSAAGENGSDEESMPRGGTGLGLTICQELVRTAGGEIRVESTEGQGAKFTLELPAA